MLAVMDMVVGAQLDGRADSPCQPLGQRLRPGDPVDLVGDRTNSSPPKRAIGVAGPHCVPEPVGHRHQQLVAGGVAERCRSRP